MIVVIPGIPIPQTRHRHRKLNNGRVMVYDPLARDKVLLKREFEALIENLIHPFEQFKMPCISFDFHMPMPRSYPVKKRKQMDTTMLRHLVKPDVDNLVKFYLDCMNGIFFHDDKTISLGGAFKFYSSDPHVEIYISEQSETIDGDIPPRDPHGLVKCGEPPSVTKDVRPYSESPYHSKPPPRHGKSSPGRGKARSYV